MKIKQGDFLSLVEEIYFKTFDNELLWIIEHLLQDK